jgi:hypothetical protein
LTWHANNPLPEKNKSLAEKAGKPVAATMADRERESVICTGKDIQ